MLLTGRIKGLCVLSFHLCIHFTGWSNPPGLPTSTIISISDSQSVTYNISWSPSEYYGGLNNTHIYYQLTISHTTINTTDTHAMVTLNNVKFRDEYTISVGIHYNYSSDTVYIPSNMLVTRHHDNLLCDTIGGRWICVYRVVMQCIQ